MHGLNTLKHQPQKIAAMEGLWHTEKGAPLVLFGLPNEQTQTNDYAIELPYMASLILTHEFEGELKGLSSFEHTPPVKPVFFAFRIMVGLGFLMILTAWLSAYFILLKKSQPTFLLRALTCMTFSGWVATLAGWYVTEIGRQPWLVTGVLKVEDAVTSIAPTHVGFSLTLYLIVYAVLLVAYIHTVFRMATKSVAVDEFEVAELPVTGLEAKPVEATK